MAIFTLEIDRRPIAAFGDVAALADAVVYFGSDSFLSQLSRYQIAGVPGIPVLVDGASRTNVRPSNEDEIEYWRQARDNSFGANEVEFGASFGVYLAEFEVLNDPGDLSKNQEPITLSEGYDPGEG